MSAPAARPIRRILLALEAGASLPLDAEAIVSLAERLHAEILALVVEDVNLLRSASLPFVRQVSLLTGSAEPLEVEWVEREMQRTAADVDERFRRAVAARGVQWSMRIVRGRAVQELTALVQDGDLVVVETPAPPRFASLGAPDLAATAAQGVSRPVLVLHPGNRLFGRPVLAIYDGSEESAAGLQLAASLADGRDGRMEVALLAPTHEQMEMLHALAQRVLSGFTGSVGWHRLVDADPRRACALAERLGSALLFVGAQSALLRERGLARVLDELRCAVWVVR